MVYCCCFPFLFYIFIARVNFVYSRYPECESILDSILENSYIRQNSLKPNLIRKQDLNNKFAKQYLKKIISPYKVSKTVNITFSSFKKKKNRELNQKG